jgi:uncharacterized protein YcbK (DUF882 family)
MTPNFSRSEFACRCGCGEDRINPELVERLQVARTSLGFAMTITSGCRCPSHNAAEGGSATSSHLVKERGDRGEPYGDAADIEVSGGAHRFEVDGVLREAGFRRIGLASGFVHCDVDTDKPSPSLFTYD